jgi:hypothetical protein
MCRRNAAPEPFDFAVAFRFSLAAKLVCSFSADVDRAAGQQSERAELGKYVAPLATAPAFHKQLAVATVGER